jgi:hypothetical protein
MDQGGYLPGQFLPGKNGPVRQFFGEADKLSLARRKEGDIGE